MSFPLQSVRFLLIYKKRTIWTQNHSFRFNLYAFSMIIFLKAYTLIPVFLYNTSVRTLFTPLNPKLRTPWIGMTKTMLFSLQSVRFSPESSNKKRTVWTLLPWTMIIPIQYVRFLTYLWLKKRTMWTAQVKTAVYIVQMVRFSLKLIF